MSEKNKKTSHIKFEISLDENSLPETIHWNATGKEGDVTQECKAFLLAVWDGNKNETLRIDLWTKDMRVDEMNLLFSQTLISMADTYQRSTGNKGLAEKIKEFGYSFGTESEVLKKNS